MDLNKKILFDQDIEKGGLDGKTVGVIGYGNQGRSQALNLSDSGVNVVVGLRKASKSADRVASDGLKSQDLSAVINSVDILAIMIPDDKIDTFLFENLPKMRKGQTLLFSHGYAIVYGETEIPQNIDIIMVAPSGGGRVVRTEYQKGFGVPALVAIENDFSGDAMRVALSYAKAIGSSKAAVFLSTFKEETETDLFGEQVLLTGSIPLIIIESYKVLLEEGYDPVVSWFVCFYEIRTIVDLMFEKGLMSFYDMVSSTARYGGLSKGSTLIDEEFRGKVKKILHNIKTGSFKRELEKSLSKADDSKEQFERIFNSEKFASIEKDLLKRVKKIN